MSRIYSLRAWQRLRLEALGSEPWCRTCRGLGLLTPADVVDHVLPVRTHPDLALDSANLQPLCKQCHDSAKKEQEARGYHSALDAAGYPVDPAHPANVKARANPGGSR